MSGLRPSNSVTNTVVDTLRIRGITESGLLTTSSSGLVSVGTAPTLTNLVVTGTSMLGTSAVVMGPLTANSVDALFSLTTPNGSITNLDASNAIIDTLTASLIEAETVNISNASITNSYISFLDVSNAIVDILDVSAASFHSLDASNASITVLDVSSASIHSLDVSNAVITYLDASAASISSLDSSNATITILDVSAASIRSLDASNATITLLDVSAATFNHLDASSALINTLTTTNATVSYGLFAKAALIGDNTNTSDPSQNFVFIQAPAGQTYGRVRGPNLANGSLQLGANSGQLSNITLNADGTTTIPTLNSTTTTVSGRFYARDALIGENTNLLDPSANFVFINAIAGQTVSNVRGSNLPTGTLQLGANSTHVDTIVLESSGVTVNAPSNQAITVSDISLNIFKPGTSNPEIRVDASGTTIYTPLPPPIFSSVGGAPYMYYTSLIGPTNSTDYNPIPQPTLPSGVYYIMGVCGDSDNSEAKISTIAFYAAGGIYNGWFAGGSVLGPPLDSDTSYPGAQLKLRVKRDGSQLECKILNAVPPAQIDVKFIFIAAYLFYPPPF